MSKSGFGDPGVTPTQACDMTVLKDAAWAELGISLSGEQCAVIAKLAGACISSALGKLGRVCGGSVHYITPSLWPVPHPQLPDPGPADEWG